MNQQNAPAFRAKPPDAAEHDREIDLAKVAQIILRRWRTLLLALVVGLLIAVAMLATTTRLYTAQVDLNIGRAPEVDTFQEFSGVAPGRLAEIEIETELQVLRSERIAERVVRTLALHEDRVFLTPPQSGVSRVIGALSGQISALLAWARAAVSTDLPTLPPLERTSDELDRMAIERAAQRLRANMTAGAVRGSRVIQIRYTSASPVLSARVADAIAQAYIEDQLEASDEASQRAIAWLRQRRDELRQQAEQTAAITERFRVEHNLLGVSAERGGDAEFDRLSQNLVTARAELVELEARNRRLTEIVASGDTSAVVRETATQGITSGLRARYLDVLRGYNSLAATLGDAHTQTQRRLRELQDIEALMFEEIRRSAELVRDDIAAARERVASLEAAQAEVGARVGGDQSILSELRQLERNAESVNTLYLSFQQRLQEATQRQEIPRTFARVLNRAQMGTRSAPNTARVLGFWTLLALIAALIHIGWREWRDDFVRSEDEIRDRLGLEYLGGLSIIKGKGSQSRPDAATEGALVLPPILRFSADNPLSHFAETLRTGKMSLTLRHGQQGRAPRIGIASGFPGEGKTTVVANFANLLAQQGARVVLIDGDMRKPGLSQALGGGFDRGLIDILLGQAPWREVIHRVAETGLHIIPNSATRVAHTAEWLGGAEMGALLGELDQAYDFVFIDLPPLGPVVDARAILDKLDGLFFVLKWGGTHLSQAERILRSDPRLQEKCYGAFLNMYDPKKARAYGGYSGYRYDRSYYGYGRDAS